ncbi:TORTIFOLIA1-like protein 3 [Tripterygium wilfordii]|uniref:TORTIFOLIA1-like protein 3 n=1 Tax=Tripterygium wilfordii TaxID=458696 RepID=UPI0018F85217|nr:TORTIFOLIA1-like protein 3 [Tripterygium wilfordii]XP_038678890.1 TORTIFOLIA1-like protein 3 [Tripterygium wilfordii]
MAQNLKLKVFTCLTKLGDRDTYSIAASELDSIVASLDSSTLSTFVSCILSTDTNDKPAVRKHCLLLLADLSISHTQSLSRFLPKILSHLIQRLRDSDSSVRSQCISTVSALTANVTRVPFSSAFLRPLSDALFTEQDRNSQVGSALCLAAAIDAAPDPDPGRLGRALMPKLERLLKEGFRAKSAVLVVVGSVIGAGGVSGRGVEGLRSLVQCLLEFLSSEDWAARKAAAEGLGRLAIVERDALPEFKAGCLKAFENRRFDKVKAVREVMNQMIEEWKQVPDVSEETSPPPRSQTSSREDAIDGRYPSGSKHSIAARSEASRMRKKSIPASRSTPPASSLATVAGKKNPPPNGSGKKTSSAMFQKLDGKKASDWNVEISVPTATSSIGDCVDAHRIKEEQGNDKTRFGKQETNRALFNRSSDGNIHKFGASRVAPCHEKTPESNVLINSGTENHNNNHKESEDLSLIRKQLVQIEKQQSSLLDHIQRFIGSSQTGIQTLETRMHGLELALDEISYDLAVTNGKMANTGSHGTTCCPLPGAEFLSPKFWRRTEPHHMTSKFSTSNGIPLAAMRRRGDKNGSAGTFMLDQNRLQLQGGGGFIVNPLAEIHIDSRGNSEILNH